jgi:hypothetical protein
MSIVNIIKAVFILLSAPIVAGICAIVLIVHAILILVLLLIEEITGLIRR